ncbi:MAG: type II secretion system F family protein [Phycisphaeraceae bacterium]|nr:type II secretion system F family protein [Phycisphaerales bacterium]MCB9843279.1 type II secretion system F family protein [Phycisphaeraceae bacterium]
MTAYRYTAISATGQRTSGTIEGDDERAVLAELDRMRLTPVEVSKSAARMGGAVGGLGGGGKRIKLGARKLGDAYSQLADLLRAGVPLLRALRLLGGQKADATLAGVFTELADEVEDGSPLADAMSDRGGIFSTIHIAMVRAGERGGFLESVFDRLGDYLRRRAELMTQVVGTLIYPGVIASVGLIAMVLLFVVFVPMFEEVFTDMELPAVTKIVLAMSGVLRSNWIVLVVIAGGASIGLWRVTTDPVWRGRLLALSLRLPVLGPLFRSLAVARFCRMLGTLLANSVPMLQSLAIAKDAAGIPAMAAAIENASESVRGGESLSGPLSESGLFSDDVIEMLKVGEEANNLESVLMKVAESAERQVERRLTVAVRLIEPMVLLGLALCVAFVAIALILPMLNLTQGIGAELR